MTTPLLSVVMPTHNRPVQLERAARSVLDQSVSALELVIVDDASTDDTPSVTERLAEDPRVRVVRNDISKGPGGARNGGIAVTNGDLLGFCDDDDAWLPGAAATLVGALESDPDLGVVTSWHRVVHDGSGRTVVYRGPTTFGADDLLWFNFVALPFGIIRRSHFGELSFDETLPPCEDWDLWLRCAQLRPIEAVPRVLYSYHQHGGDRVTNRGDGDRGGRAKFLDKHAHSMTTACRIYHQAVIAEQEEGRSAMLRVLAAASPAAPAAAAFASSVLATSFATSTLGMRRGDPGFPSRVMARLVGSERHHAGTSGAGR